MATKYSQNVIYIFDIIYIISLNRETSKTIIFYWFILIFLSYFYIINYFIGKPCNEQVYLKNEENTNLLSFLRPIEVYFEIPIKKKNNNKCIINFLSITYYVIFELEYIYFYY